jgi:hypothetical protein
VTGNQRGKQNALKADIAHELQRTCCIEVSDEGWRVASREEASVLADLVVAKLVERGGRA